jgi:hypothetical protein
MAIVNADVTIKGISPLLMNSFPLHPVEALMKKSIEEQAENAVYRDPVTKNLFIPGVAIQRGMIGAATFSKGKGRASLQKPVAACVMVNPERIDLGTTTYAIDSRAVVVPATKGRVVRHRPRLDQWVATFKVEWDDTLLKETEVRRVLDDMGSRVGLLDFRPEKKGPFGRFMITSWKAVA